MVEIRKAAKNGRILLNGFVKANAEYKVIKIDGMILLRRTWSNKKGIGELQFEKILAALKQRPMTYNELLDAVPEFKEYSRPLNSLRPVILRYGMQSGKEIIEYTKDRPLKLKLKKSMNSKKNLRNTIVKQKLGSKIR